MVTCRPSITMWDHFPFPQNEEKHWKEEVLSHYPGKVVDVRACMPGIKLMMQNEEGWYRNATHALKYEGHMLIYDPQKDVSQWVPVRGVSASLTSSELRSANDLNNMREEEESDTDSCGEPSDSGEELDKAECSDWSHCPALPLGQEGPTWAEATRRIPVQRKIIADEQAPLGKKWSATLHKRRSPLTEKTQTGMMTPA